jgi:hypothetical protein
MLIIQQIYVYRYAHHYRTISHKMLLTHVFLIVQAPCLQIIWQEDVLNIAQEGIIKHLQITHQDSVFLSVQMVPLCKIQLALVYLNVLKDLLIQFLNSVLVYVQLIIMDCCLNARVLQIAHKQHHNFMLKITLICANQVAF